MEVKLHHPHQNMDVHIGSPGDLAENVAGRIFRINK